MNLVLTRGREGVQNPEILADVICERPLYKEAWGSIRIDLAATRATEVISSLATPIRVPAPVTLCKNAGLYQ